MVAAYKSKTPADFLAGDAKRYQELMQVQGRERTTSVILELLGIEREHEGDQAFWNLVQGLKTGQQPLF